MAKIYPSSITLANLHKWRGRNVSRTALAGPLLRCSTNSEQHHDKEDQEIPEYSPTAHEMIDQQPTLRQY